MNTMSKLIGQVKEHPFLISWLAFLAALIGVGVYGAYQIEVHSEGATLTWGLLVPSYVFFALSATGSSLVNSISTVFGVKRFKPIIKRGILLSIILVIPAALFIILDLAKTEHVLNLYLLFHPTSRMAWMGLLYILFALSLIIELIVVIWEEHLPKWTPLFMGIIVLAVTLIVHTNLGALFGAITAKPFWSTHLMPLAFIISAMMVGACFHIVFMSASYFLRTKSIPDELRKLFSMDYRPLLIGLIIINFAMIAIKIIPELFSTEASAYVKLLLAGPYSGTFWGLEIVIGGIIPLIILLSNKAKESLKWLLGAAVLIIIGVFFSKYNLVIVGQSIGPVFTEDFIPYFPSAADILLVVGGIAVCLLVYTFGEVLLPLEPEEKPTWFIFGKTRLSLK